MLLTILVGLYLWVPTALQGTKSLDVWPKIGRQITHSLVKIHMPFGANEPAYHIIITHIPQLKYT